MMRILVLAIAIIPLWGEPFSVASFNAGDLPDHYDYIRAVCMGKIMQQEEPNASMVEAIITPYNVRPIVVSDAEIRAYLESIDIGQERRKLAKKIFAEELKQDIIALQEIDYLDEELFPEEYELLLEEAGIAWKKSKFTLVQVLLASKRILCVELENRQTGERIAFASAHLKGCNPIVGDPGAESGNQQLLAIIEALESSPARIKIIAMDANVTDAHPRLNLLEQHAYKRDRAHLYPTCTHPALVTDLRIDWIAVKGSCTIENIPVEGVRLNSPETNMSDHRPIAAIIESVP